METTGGPYVHGYDLLEAVHVPSRMVYVDDSRLHLVDGFTRRTFTAWSDVLVRLEESTRLRARLEQVAANGRTWMAVHRCRACGAAWASERPFSERQGGGPELHYRVEAADPIAWLDTATPIVDAIRRAEEDRPFFAALGPDVGPERCRQAGCTRLRIDPGLYCRCHHFEMVMRRACPFWKDDPAT